MEERRKSSRYKAREDISAAISAEDSDLHTDGLVLNISKGGAYVFAASIPFKTGIVTFRLKDGTTIQRRCRRIDPHLSKARGQAVSFLDDLSDQELEALKAPIVD
jgi:hypothetical protein